MPYDAVAPGPGDDQSSRLAAWLETILTGAATVRPVPLISHNAAHIRGAGNTKQVLRGGPATLEELGAIVASRST